ncbi:MAG: BspA family leucine-rich repeat surface protein [Cytophagales bacterium]|nr:BspA family leucine-rich repeat surface protein [Cytophagales bacterium]MDW8383133.1 BspA family leucine-rich repeat surface protein [Flammeovirgaceae bacterium]
MKYVLSIACMLLYLWEVNAQPGHFITKWYFANPTLKFNFYALTTGPVNYTWSTSSGNSGSGSFNQNPLGIVTIFVTTGANDTLTLSIEPANLRRFANNDLFPNLDATKLIDVTQWGNVQWSSMENAFWGCTNLKISATDAPNLSNVTSMFSMFYGASSFNQSINHWNVSNVQNMSMLFFNATSFNQPLNNWNVSNVTNMMGMFAGATSFNQNINNWNVSNVQMMANMFRNATSFNQPLNNWNVSNVTNMVAMFNGATAFNQPLNNWNVNNVTMMTFMFAGAKSFNQNINNWNVSNVTNMMGMFSDASSFNQPLNNWNVSNVTSFSGMFQKATSFNQPIGNWNINAFDLSAMFDSAVAFNQPLNWNTSNVQSMANMFRDAKSFNQNINSWNVSNVFTFGGMFSGATSFNQPLSNWNTSNAIDMSYMFAGATSFNQPLNTWNLNNVSSTIGMFQRATSFNQPLNSWNTSSVISMSFMFDSAISFNQPINNWNVSNVTDMAYMFRNAKSFNQPLNSWGVSSVTNMSYMFAGATSFNQPLNTWNVSNVTDMSHMFDSAAFFNQPLGSWTFNTAVNLTNMLRKSGMDCIQYSATLSGWASNMSTPNGRTLGATGLKYSPSAAASRNTLITGKGWSITGDAMASSACLPTTKWNGTAWNNGTPAAGMEAVIEANYNTQLHGNISTARVVVDAGDTLFIHSSGNITVTDSVHNNGVIRSCGGTINGPLKGNAPQVASAPSITTQPANQTVVANSSATFNVVASGGFLNYQWKQGLTNVGTNASSYTTPPTTLANSGKKYAVIVSNFCGSVLSDSATLTVNPASSIWNGTSWSNGVPNTSTNAFINGKYQTNVHGNLSAYKIIVNDTLFVHASGIVSAVDSIKNNGVVRSCGGTLSGTFAGNAVASATTPVITVQPTNQTVTQPATATFTVTATGNFLSYQWKQGNINVGTNSNSYTTPPTSFATDNGKKYVVVVSNFCGSVTSDSATLIVQTLTSIPAEDGISTLAVSYSIDKTIYTEVAVPAEVLVYNANGAIVGKGTAVQVNAPGIYLIRIITERGETKVSKLLVK